MTRTVALIQARMSSTRFPGKVLADLGGKPMIAFMVERARRARLLDEVAVITSADPTDDPLAEVLESRNIPTFRGDLHDVLMRYAAGAASFDASTVVRLTGDCPLVDPTIVDSVVGGLVEAGADYCSNVAPPSFADGLDVECFSRDALNRAANEAKKPSEREHVTLWMRAPDTDLLRINVAALVDSSHLRLTVDYPDDLDMVRSILGLIGAEDNEFDYYDILRCLDARRDLLEINRHARNEGLLKSSAQAVD